MSQNCCVCMNNQKDLISISTTDTNHVQWSNKLIKCVPEVDWSCDCFICPKCIQQLEIAYVFYNLCLQSYELRKQQVYTIKMEPVQEDEIQTAMNNVNWLSPKSNEDEVDVKSFIQSTEYYTNDVPDSCLNTNSSDEDEEFSNGPSEITKESNPASNFMQLKSRRTYDRAHDEFQRWLKANNANPKCISENLLLAYFSELSETQKSSSLWPKFSMLRATLMVKDNIDIKKFKKLLSFLKNMARGYKAKKSKAFTLQEIVKFLKDAPDDIYLMKKVAIIIGIAGGCRIEQLTYLELDNIQDMGSVLLVTVKESETKMNRRFTVINYQDSNFPNMLDIYRKYISLRPAHTSHKRLFLQYIRGKCTTQVVGIHTIGKIPSQIAEYLNLPEPLSYTGHSLRKTSAAIAQTQGI